MTVPLAGEICFGFLVLPRLDSCISETKGTVLSGEGGWEDFGFGFMCRTVHEATTGISGISTALA